MRIVKLYVSMYQLIIRHTKKCAVYRDGMILKIKIVIHDFDLNDFDLTMVRDNNHIILT